MLSVLAGCGGGGAADGPPEIQYGLEECSYCRMIVSEERFAAALTAESEEARFDDVGCLLSWLGERDADPVVWVHDHAGGGWIRASEAWVVRDPTGGTPMGSGLVAFAERSAAEGFATERRAEVLTWAQVLAPDAPR